LTLGKELTISSVIFGTTPAVVTHLFCIIGDVEQERERREKMRRG
jgi:hypothetical protein